MATQQTIDQLVGLSVAMLGQAPGTKWLSDRAEDVDGGATLQDVANQIQSSDDFKADYPVFSDEVFARDFLGDLFGGHVTEAAMKLAVDYVAGLLGGGTSRGEVALALVDALTAVAGGDRDTELYSLYGKAAVAFHNKVMVAKYHTEEARRADPSETVLEGVTDDPATVETAKRDIDSPPADAVFGEPGAFGLDENASGAETPVAVGRVEATDANGDEVTYRLVDAPDGFAIDAATGAVTYTGEGLDHEAAATVELTVHASSTGANGQPTEVPLAVAVNVNDIQESDAVFADAMLAIDENEAEGMVGTVTATDAEGDAVAYRLAEGSPAGFSIDGATGEVSYKGDGLDHETSATVDLTVIATSIGANNMPTDVSQTFTVNVGDIDDLPDEPMRFVLTPTIDNFTGGDLDDTFVAQPVQGADNLFSETLNSFDSIDGGGGTDTIHIFGVNPRETLRLGAEDITNVENVVINTVGGIDADLSDWTGLEMVKLDRFGRDDDSNVRIIVDGAAVNSDRPFNGNVTMVGADGAVDIAASGTSVVHIGSAGHTETVMVKGGASVRVDNGASSGDKHSETVTMVSVDGVERDLGKNGVRRGPGKDDGPVKNPHFVDNDDDRPASATNRQYLRENFDNEVVPYYKTTAAVGDSATNGIGWYDSFAASQVATNEPEDDATAITAAQALYDKLTTNDPEKAAQGEGNISITDDDDKASVHIHSNAIESVHLANNEAIVSVENDSMMENEDGKMVASPEKLTLTVNKFGKHIAGAVEGEVRVDGGGSAEDISIKVDGNSNFALASNKVKMLDIMGDGKLTLDVNKLTGAASETLAAITVAGETGLTINMNGHTGLKSVDASESSGDNNLSSSNPETGALTPLLSLETVTTGAGDDSVRLATGATGKLEMISTGGGDDTVEIAGPAVRLAGLKVDLGDGDDTYSAMGDNRVSRIEAGEGMDTLHLTHGSGATYLDDERNPVSIYQGFDKLDASDGRGDYDLRLLGITSGDVEIHSGSATTVVDLHNMSDGMGLHVAGKKATKANNRAEFGTTANVEHVIADRKPGESRYSGDLNVTLAANGFGDNKGNMDDSQSGQVNLTLMPDKDTATLNITSNAKPGPAKTVVGLTAAHYQNSITIRNATDADGLEEIFVGGNAGLMISVPAGRPTLELLDASDNSGGVVFNASAVTGDGAGELELYGGSGVDELTAAAGRANTIAGGGGGDMLTAGTGNDTFEYGPVSDSQLGYKANGTLDTDGVDTITGFAAGDAVGDVISLGRALFRSLEGTIKSATTDPDGAGAGAALGLAWTISALEADTVPNPVEGGDPVERTDNNNLERFILSRANGFFETTTPDSEGGFGGTVNHHSIALVEEVDDIADNATVHWLFIDVDGDGDFSIDNDMVIKLMGLTGNLTPIGVGSDFSA